MKTRTYTQRKRAVTSCSECVRRKQKCNRCFPCDVCIGRKVPGLCKYGSYGKQICPTSSRALNESEDAFIEEASLDSQSFIDQMGYSSEVDHSLTTTMQRSLALNDNLWTPKIAPSRVTPAIKDKYCRLLSQIPSHEILRQFINLYFEEANWMLLVLEKCFFEKDYASWLAIREVISKDGSLGALSRDLQYFPALLFQIMAVALQFMPSGSRLRRSLGLTDAASVDVLSRKYTSLGLEVMFLLGRHAPALASIQHDLLRVQWLKNQGRGSDSWDGLGLAIRQAQQVGLHLQPKTPFSGINNDKDSLFEYWYQEYRKRVWVTLFNCDAHMALILGRPRTIHVDDCTVMPPIDCDIFEDMLCNLPSTASNQHIPSSYTPVIFQHSMAHKIHEMFSSGAARPHIRNYSKVVMLDEEIIKLVNDLPPAVRPQDPDTSWDLQLPNLPKQRQQIACIAWSYLMSLHRPHVEEHAESRCAAIEYALKTLDAQEKLINLLDEHHYIVYGFSVYSIDAGMFLSAMILNFPLEDQQIIGRIDAALKQAITRLGRMKDRSAIAASGAKVLQRCYQSIQSVLLQHYPNPFSSSGSSGMLENLTPAEAGSFVGWPVAGDLSFYANAVPGVFDAGLMIDGTLSMGIPSLASEYTSSISADPYGHSAGLEPSYPGNFCFR